MIDARNLRWPLVIAAKIVLSRLPFSYRFWRALKFFRHGAMGRPDYAWKVSSRHFGRARMSRDGRGFTVLELGPGDSVATAISAYAVGATMVFLVDDGRYARQDPGAYRAMCEFLGGLGLPVPAMEATRSMEALLAACNAHYLTDGIASLRSLPDGVVDLCFSQAVLEHVRKAEFADLVGELRRVTRRDGVGSHRIDLGDHLAGGLNNLRFSDTVWESPLFARSGFYTNRIRYREMLEIFTERGFSAEVVQVDRWAELPTDRGSFASRFRHLDDEELRVFGFDVLLSSAGESELPVQR